MLEQIGTVDNIPNIWRWPRTAPAISASWGFGHRVYKNFDPRAKIIREACHEVLRKLGDNNNPLFELALRLEEIALKDEYFVSRKLYPNVDFYSGVIYSALGIPRSMFTVMFAIARTVGWVAHWLEMVSDPAMRIGRPRQLYTDRCAAITSALRSARAPEVSRLASLSGRRRSRSWSRAGPRRRAGRRDAPAARIRDRNQSAALRRSGCRKPMCPLASGTCAESNRNGSAFTSVAPITRLAR